MNGRGNPIVVLNELASDIKIDLDHFIAKVDEHPLLWSGYRHDMEKCAIGLGVKSKLTDAEMLVHNICENFSAITYHFCEDGDQILEGNKRLCLALGGIGKLLNNRHVTEQFELLHQKIHSALHILNHPDAHRMTA